RAVDVADDERGVAPVAGLVRRTTIGAHAAFPGGLGHRHVRARSRPAGLAVGAPQQSARHDHRLVCHPRTRRSGMNRDRRMVILGGVIAGSGGLLSGCDALSRSPRTQCTIKKAEQVSERSQRALARDALAPEYAEKDISKDFRANGSVDPNDADYMRLKANGF